MIVVRLFVAPIAESVSCRFVTGTSAGLQPLGHVVATPELPQRTLAEFTPGLSIVQLDI